MSPSPARGMGSMTYLNCALIPIPEDGIDTYRGLAEEMAEVWLEHGARQYRDYVGDDLDVSESGARSFPEVVGLEEDETVVIATLTFDSREHRDEVEAEVMEDPRVGEIMGAGAPFDPSRMAGGGFDLIVEG